MKAIERLYKYIENKGVKPAQFERENNLSNGYLGKQLKRNADLGETILNRIIENNPDLSYEWLLIGKGSIVHEEDTVNVVNESQERYGLKNEELLPLVFQKDIVGFGHPKFSIAEKNVKEYYVIPKFKHKHIDFMLEVEGNGMYPIYNSGDLVACTIINKSNFIQWNKVYVIDTKEQGILIKRINKGSKPKTYTLISDNDNYAPFEVHEDEIKGIALVVGVIRVE